jgi:cytochrome c553
VIQRQIPRILLLGVLTFCAATVGLGAEPESLEDLGQSYAQQVRPLLLTFCLDCHSTRKMEGELDLERFTSLAELRKDPRVWQQVIEMLDHGEMPPEKAKQLPETESATELTVRQLVEKHRAVAACAKCHDRIDPFGFALEGFDTVGRARDTDLAGRPIDTRVVLAGGATFDGLDGLRRYLLEQRRDQFLRQFSRKLLGYALGRAVQISDEPLLDEMARRLVETNYRITDTVEVIVTSRQFRYQRGREYRVQE